MSLLGKVVIAQGGGPTHVINQSLVGTILESRKFSQVTKIYGALNGVEGIVNENFMDLSHETSSNLEQIAKTPAAALLSTREKPDNKYCAEVFKVLKAHDVRYFFYIGGNDSSNTLKIVKDNALKENYDFRVVHIPKTIDNDLVLNDHTPGYGSAARFVAQAFMGINLDNRSLGGVYIGIVMGRHTGFLAAAASAGKIYPDDGPHLIYLPEKIFDIDKFLINVKEVYDRYGRCVIALSEGIQDKNGIAIATKFAKSLEKDAHGNIHLEGNALGIFLADEIKKKLNIKRVRMDTFGYLQRSFLENASDVDQREAREVGEKAAQFALWDNLSGSVAIKRIGDYSVNYTLEKIRDISGKTKLMPDEFINKAGNNVTDKFYFYVRPLLGSNFPSVSRLRAPFVTKILKKQDLSR